MGGGRREPGDLVPPSCQDKDKPENAMMVLQLDAKRRA
jgi:hypothetical protein